jgi:transposase
METVVGLDIHCKEMVFCGRNQAEEEFCKGRVATTPLGMRELRDRYQIPRGTKMGMESGTHAFFVHRHLKELGYEPVIIHAQEVKKKKVRPKQKDDMRDAKEICHGLQHGIYEQIVHVPEEKYLRLRRLLSARRHFVNARSNEVRSAKHAIRSAGLKKMYRKLTTEVAWKNMIQRLTDAEELELAWRAKVHFDVWQVNNAQVEKLDEEVRQLLNDHPEIQESVDILKTIPGVGRIVALTAVAIYAEVKRFRTAKQASSYVGLVTETRHSADKKKYGHITKDGSPELRAMLVEAAHHANKPHHVLNPFFRKLRAKRGYKVAVVACAHRLCRIIYAMLRDGQEFDATRAKPVVPPTKSPRRYVLRRG